MIFPVSKFDAFKLPESRGVTRALFERGGGGVVNIHILGFHVTS